ncbi:MAG: serine/threonine protein kinase [Planctomycetes bacterium]|nr:serine/threonine protein kinase [Planctomycetota bacterium]
MHDPNDSTTSILFDLADQLLTDGAEGRLEPLAHYLARFPGHEEQVAREYIATSRALGLEPPDRDRTPSTRASDAEDDARARSRSRPEQIGPYKVLDVLGRGGQGVVYRAEDQRLGRVVALKVLSLSLASVSQGRRTRFRREAAIVSRLDHPGICTILDADLESDTPYIAMRFVEGETLAVALARARDQSRTESTPSSTTSPSSPSRILAPTRALEFAEALTFFEKTARALHAAHEAGVVHRDVKPGNIMVAADGAPVVLDFGLARGEEEETAHLTRSDEVFGTPAYISPEQLESGKHVDRRTDVYSLGVVLYECLTLERPFQGDTGAALADAIRRAHMPSPLRANPSIPNDLVVVLETALEKDVERRYATALELAEELRRVREYEPIRARPAGPLLKLTRWSQRNPVLATGTIGSIATLSIALGVALVLLRRVGSERNQKEQALQLYEAAFYRDKAAAAQGLYPLSALRLALDAADRDPSLSSNRVLLTALDGLYQKQAIAWPEGHGTMVDIAPDGARLLIASAEGRARLWDPHTGLELARFEGHADSVNCVRFSPDGLRCVTVSNDATGRIWRIDAPTEKPLVLAGHTRELQWAEFSPDGARVVTAGRDRLAIVWDARDGRELARCIGHAGNISEARFVAGGRYVLTRSGEPLADHSEIESDRTARLFDSATGAELLVFEGHTDQVRGLAFTRDLRWVATAASDSTVHVHRLALEGPPRIEDTRVIALPGRASSVDFSPDGTRLAFAFDAGARVIEVATGRTQYELPSHDRRAVVWIAFSPDGERLATVAYDNAVRLFRASDGLLERTCRGDTRAVQALAWSPDGRWIATWQRKPEVDLWYAAERPFLQVLRGHVGEVVSVRFDPKAERVLSASKDGVARLWSASDGRSLLVVPPAEDGSRPLVGAQFDAAGERFLVTDDRAGVRLFAAGDGRELWRHAGGAETTVAAGFDPSGELVCAPEGRGGLRIVQLATGRSTHLDAHAAELMSVRFAPSGGQLATGGADRCVSVFEIHRAGDGPLATLLWRTPPFEVTRTDLDRVFDIAFDPSGPRLVAAYQNMDCPLFDLATGKLLAKMRAQTLGRLAFTRDGRRLYGTSKWINTVSTWNIDEEASGWTIERVPIADTAGQFHANSITSLATARNADAMVTGSLDRTARLWDVNRRECVAAFEGHTDAVWDVDISADGLRIVTASADGTVRLWPGDLRAEARRFQPAGMNISFDPGPAEGGAKH